MDDERGLLSSIQQNIHNSHNGMLPHVAVNGNSSGQQTPLPYNQHTAANPHAVHSPMTITTSGNNHNNYSHSQPQSQSQPTSAQYNHHHNHNLPHNYPRGGNNNEGGNQRMLPEGRNVENRNDSKQSQGQGLAAQFSNTPLTHILPSAAQPAPKIFHQHFEAKVQEVVGRGNGTGVNMTSSSTRPASASLEYHHHHSHNPQPQLPLPRAEGKSASSNPLMTSAMLASAQTQAKLRGAGYSEYTEKVASLVSSPSPPPLHPPTDPPAQSPRHIQQLVLSINPPLTPSPFPLPLSLPTHSITTTV